MSTKVTNFLKIINYRGARKTICIEVRWDTYVFFFPIIEVMFYFQRFLNKKLRDLNHFPKYPVFSPLYRSDSK